MNLTNRADLSIALRGAYEWEDEVVRSALLLTQGPEVQFLLRQAAADPNEDLPIRTRAMIALSLDLNPASADVLLRVADEPGGLGYWAMAALQTLPYPAVCDFWRRTLLTATKDTPGLDFALFGMGICGAPADAALLREVRSRGVSATRGKMIAESIRKLQLPIAERFAGTALEGNVPGAGPFRPPPALQERIRKTYCAQGCPDGAVIPLEALAAPPKR